MKGPKILRICQEIDILVRADHPNIIKIYEYFLYKNCIFIVMEIVKGGDLFDLVMKKKVLLDEKSVKLIMVQLLRALNYLHKNNIGKYILIFFYWLVIVIIFLFSEMSQFKSYFYMESK